MNRRSQTSAMPSPPVAARSWIRIARSKASVSPSITSELSFRVSSSSPLSPRKSQSSLPSGHLSFWLSFWGSRESKRISLAVKAAPKERSSPTPAPRMNRAGRAMRWTELAGALCPNHIAATICGHWAAQSVGMTVMDQIQGSDSASPRAKIAATPDDRAMLRAAAELPRDLLVAKGKYYWPDFLAAAFVGYGALAVTILTPSLPVALASAVLAVFAALSRRRLHP